MSEDDGLGDPQLREARAIKSACASGVHTLLHGQSLWPKPGQREDTEFLRGQIDKTARFEVLTHAVISRQQYHWIASVFQCN
jgi:hypothetical protein